MISDALNIASTSLKAQQKAIDVVSHNITNVNTPGYSRQRPDLTTQTPDRIGAHNFGRGVDLGSINRLVDPLIDRAQAKNNTEHEFWKKMHSGLNTIENVFGSLNNTGLASAVDDFFLAWQQLANNPQDQAQRYNVRTKSESVATHFNNMSTQLLDAQRIVDTEIDSHLARANLLLDEVAALTTQIIRKEGVTGVQGRANDLRDQRDSAVRNLSALIPIQQVETQDGGFLIQSLSGDLLTQHDTARHLVRSAAVSSSGFTNIVIEGSNAPVTGLDSGGVVGGLLTLRDDNLANYISQMDSMAANLTFGVNQLHASGGGSSRASSLTSGAGSANVTASIKDPVAQGVSFASQIANGTFDIYVYDAAGAPLTPVSKTTITINATTSTMTSIKDDINAITGVTASLDTSGRLVIDAGTNTVGFANDSSNFLAAFEVNNFFQGSTANGIALSANVVADVGLISAGRIDPITSQVEVGDNRVAIEILALQDKALSFDGTSAASIYERVSVLSANYGNDVAAADQQRLYRASEADSLKQQRAAISGVSIDEELVEMIKFQRAYEASAKVIQTSNQMLDALMGLIR